MSGSKGSKFIRTEHRTESNLEQFDTPNRNTIHRWVQRECTDRIQNYEVILTIKKQKYSQAAETINAPFTPFVVTADGGHSVLRQRHLYVIWLTK